MARIAICDGESGNTLSLAYRLTQEGHEVRLWVKPLSGEALAQQVGRGLVSRVASPRAVADFRPDVVIAHQTPAEADALRASGFKVWGSSKTATRLEKDRQYAAKVATDAGLTVPTMRRFTNPVDAERFLADQSREAWVFKAEGGADVASSTTHVCRSKEELLAVLDYEARLNRAKSFVLQAKVDGVEISVEGWFDYRIGWLQPFNSTFEGKHLFHDGCGPLTGAMGSVVFPWTERMPSLVSQTLERLTDYLQGIQYLGPFDVNLIIDELDQLPKFLEFCYSEDTEVLTDKGWRPMKDIRKGDILATLKDDHYLAYEAVEQTTRLRWKDEMIHVKSKYAYDLLVTPNHKMVFQKEDGTLYEVAAKDMTNHGDRTVRTAKWDGKDIPTYTIPEYIESHICNRHKFRFPISHGQRLLPMEDWCRFLGLFLAEGNVHRGKGAPYQVCITQHTKVVQCDKIIGALGFTYRYDGHQFRINSIQLGTHLDKIIGKSRCWDKRVPRFILDLSPKYIAAFVEGFCVGDGSIHKRTGQRTFFTTSKGLADDLSECLLRLGSWGRIKRKKPGSFAYGKRDIYVVCERLQRKDGRIFPKKHVSREMYDGCVICVTVPNHRIYVRRPDGPAIWCAQTPRLGWDACEAFMVGFDGDFGRFCVEFGSGLAPSMKFMEPFAAVVKVLIPTAKDVPVLAPWQGSRAYMPKDVWLDKGMLRSCGSWDESGFSAVLEVGDTGQTPMQAMDRALMNVREVHAPNVSYRIDIGEMAERSLSRLSFWGYGLALPQMDPITETLGIAEAVIAGDYAKDYPRWPEAPEQRRRRESDTSSL